MPENFNQLRLAPRKIPPYGGFQRKTAAGINYNYILTKLRSQNAFFTPFKHPLPDDSQRGHPIAPNQTAGTTSQSWTVGKQRPPENIIHIIKQKQALRLLRFTLPSQPSIFSPPPSLSPPRSFLLGAFKDIPYKYISHACKYLCAYTVVSTAHAQVCVRHITYACARSPLVLRQIKNMTEHTL